jgi:Stress responsive A/B Barrel Domain
MKNVMIGALVLALGLVLGLEATARIGKQADPKLGHMVFFWLKDHSKESRDKLIASSEKLLSGHEGAVYFSIGTRAEDSNGPANVKDFDMALHVVFTSKEAEAKYLKSPRHTQFVEDNSAQFEKVQVFDSYLVKE